MLTPSLPQAPDHGDGLGRRVFFGAALFVQGVAVVAPLVREMWLEAALLAIPLVFLIDNAPTLFPRFRATDWIEALGLIPLQLFTAWHVAVNLLRGDLRAAGLFMLVFVVLRFVHRVSQRVVGGAR